MDNRCTLAQLRDMTAPQVAALPVDQLAMLVDDVAELKADTKRVDELLYAGMVLAFGDKAAALRVAGGKLTGTVTIDEGEYVIRADAPKKVEWDQATLREAADKVRGWGEDPADYMATVLAVPESKYSAWPPAIRAVFEPARTVATGKQTFKIERNKKGKR